MADYDIGRAFERIENELISSMMRNLKHHRAEETKEGIQWSQWQVEQLKALEAYKKENKKRFSPQFAKINQKITEAIKAAYSQGGMEQEVKILKALQKGYTGYARKFDGTTDIEGSFFKVNERKLNSLINSTVNDMKKAEHAVLRMSDDKYRKIIFDAQVYANAGGTTYEKAVDMATHDFLSAGINCIEYKNGARHTISDYADMAIRTANKRAYLRGEGTKRAEWGIHTVIVNKRGNACPLCAPFCGMVLIDDVYSGGSAKDGDYPLVSTAMAAGFLHPRCQDVFTTYFEGISTPPEKEQLTREESEQLAEKAKQKQRKDYAENQLKRMTRLAKHSLDEDNRKMYSQRAEKWQKKAEEIEEKLSEPVANSGESGIIRTTEVVNADSVVGTWKPRPNFDSLIDDIIDYQGFNGKPTIIYDQSKFDEAVQRDHFLAERTIRAQDKATLNLFSNQLKAVNGEEYFYVNCNVGGAQYGQGMYCAADYTKGKEPFENFLHEIKEYGDGDKIENGCYCTTWMTFDPTAKILELPDGAKAAEYIPELYTREYMLKHAGDNIQDVLNYIEKCDVVDKLTLSEPENIINMAYSERNAAFDKVKELRKEASNSTMYLPEGDKFPIFKDPGVLAAEMGYDAINAVGHGATNSYTVVLNRTKLIIYGGDNYVYSKK